MSAPPAPAPAPPSAGQRVAHTPELLEEILLHLDDGNIKHLKSLLQSQRVSHQFRATIQGSAKLLRALFLNPTPGKRRYYTHNPFFGQSSSDSRFNMVFLPISGWYNVIRAHVDCSVVERIFDGTDDVWVTFRTFDPDDEVRSLEREESWRKMVLMDSDYCVTTVKVHKSSYGSGKHVFKGYWGNPTFGELFDVAFPKPWKG
ncbi:uncharacterized protein MYCFIDRAFT_199728 [Pseudocercospora fijiensis CIRAD86]|uniref:F-box domain-containing protein n=1 Tax=Pseudocercospora fijiensis (strain CIRAD86) TaxID=383855 RepID=M2ZHD5_PSEFD|nr:uncharacterized protein MYCFIDRAFT_199728 [Pseudocercospora fijiensis CIRAD86]EME78549.1 hypothetical protein MYCFIDRAFT_199728 [Pseudocercospora fijiensis CIRAD86]